MRTAISALLLTFITAISAGFIIYPWVMGIIGRIQSSVPSSILRIESYSMNNSCLTITISNGGGEKMTITDIYSNNVQILQDKVQIDAYSSKTIRLHGEFEKGKIYKIKILYEVYLNKYSYVFYAKYD